MAIDIYKIWRKEGTKEGSHLRFLSFRRMAEGGAAAVAIAEGAFVRARYQAQPTQSIGVSRESRSWALRHVMPSPETVSRRFKTASEAAISGLPFTVSYICVVY
jgi:hypothetical protein